MLREFSQTDIEDQAKNWLAQQSLYFPSHPRMASSFPPGNREVHDVETELMAHFRDSGDRTAFEWLYRLTAAPLGHWIQLRASRAGLGVDADEILQDTYINIYRYNQSFAGHGTYGFRRWARTIAANALHRSHRARAVHLVEWTENHHAVEDPNVDPACELQDREQAHALGMAYLLLLQWIPLACAQLSPRDRYVLTALHSHGASYREVETELELRPGALKMIVHRARARLRGHLQQIALRVG